MRIKTNNGRLRRLFISGEGARALDLLNSEELISARELLRALAPRSAIAALDRGGESSRNRNFQRAALAEAMGKAIERLPESFKDQKCELTMFRVASAHCFWAWALISGEGPLAGMPSESRARALAALEETCPGSIGGRPINKGDLQNLSLDLDQASEGEPAWSQAGRAPRGLELIWAPVAAKRASKSQLSQLLAEACSGRAYNALALLESPDLKHPVEEIAFRSALRNWAVNPPAPFSLDDAAIIRHNGKQSVAEDCKNEAREWLLLGEKLWVVNKPHFRDKAEAEAELFSQAIVACQRKVRFDTHESIQSAFSVVFAAGERLGWSFPSTTQVETYLHGAFLQMERAGQKERVKLTAEGLRCAYEEIVLNGSLDAGRAERPKARL